MEGSGFGWVGSAEVLGWRCRVLAVEVSDDGKLGEQMNLVSDLGSGESSAGFLVEEMLSCREIRADGSFRRMNLAAVRRKGCSGEGCCFGGEPGLAEQLIQRRSVAAEWPGRRIGGSRWV